MVKIWLMTLQRCHKMNGDRIMAKRSRKKQKSQTNTTEYVIVTFTEDSEQAKEYELLLKASEIPALVKEPHGETESSGFAVMVPEDFIDEAHVIVESQDAYDDFCDYAMDDEEDAFGNDFFDDDF